MGLMLDTSALVAIARACEASVPFVLEAEETYAIPAIVWAEALAGVRMAPDASRAARRLARLEAIRRVTGIVYFNPMIAEHYADIFTELSRQGSLIPQNAIAGAATGRATGFGVLVGPNDEAYFRRVPGLEVKVLNARPEISRGS